MNGMIVAVSVGALLLVLLVTLVVRDAKRISGVSRLHPGGGQVPGYGDADWGGDGGGSSDGGGSGGGN